MTMTKDIPDYQKYLTYKANPYNVDVLRERVAASGGDPGNAITVIQDICDGTIDDLDQDGLQRAYFELTLLEVGAKLTYSRVRLQPGAHYPPVPSPESLRISLEELEELIICMKDIGWKSENGWSDKDVQDVIGIALRLSGIFDAKLADLDWRGRDFIYQRFVRAFVNPGASLETYPYP